MEKVIIRSASRKDIQELLEIKIEETFNSIQKIRYQPPSLTEVSTWYEDKLSKNYPVICAIIDGRIVGYATYGPLYGNETYTYSVEYWLYVKRDSRSKGAGRLLLMTIVEHAKAENFSSIVTFVDSSNKKGFDFHNKLGFKVLTKIRKVGFNSNDWTDVSILEMRLKEKVNQITFKNDLFN